MPIADKRVNLPIVTAIPANGTLGSYAEVRVATRVDIEIECSAGSGDVNLLRWSADSHGGIGAWYPFANPQAKMTVNSALLSGRAQFRFDVGKDQFSRFCLLVPGGITISEATIYGVDG